MTPGRDMLWEHDMLPRGLYARTSNTKSVSPMYASPYLMLLIVSCNSPAFCVCGEFPHSTSLTAFVVLTHLLVYGPLHRMAPPKNGLSGNDMRQGALLGWSRALGYGLADRGMRGVPNEPPL